MTDALNPELDEVVQSLRDRFQNYVEVSDGPPFTVWVTPKPDASPMYLIDMGTEFVFGVGRGGCRWELEFTQDDLGFFRRVWDAVIAGEIREVFGPARSRVQVTLQDHTTVQTGQADIPRGCLPVPFWTRNTKRTVQYEPYSNGE